MIFWNEIIIEYHLLILVNIIPVSCSPVDEVYNTVSSAENTPSNEVSWVWH